MANGYNPAGDFEQSQAEAEAQKEATSEKSGLGGIWNQITGGGKTIIGPSQGAYQQLGNVAAQRGGELYGAGWDYSQNAPTIYNPYAGESRSKLAGAYGGLGQLGSYYQSVLSGGQPTAAQNQFMQAQNQAIASQMAMARSARGGTAQALAGRQAMQGATTQEAQAAAGSAALRAQEMQAAAQGMGQVYGQQGQLAQAQYGLETQTAEQQANLQLQNQQQINAMKMGYINAGMNEQQAQLAALQDFTSMNLQAQGIQMSPGGQGQGSQVTQGMISAAMAAMMMSDPNAKAEAYNEGYAAGSGGGQPGGYGGPQGGGGYGYGGAGAGSSGGYGGGGGGYGGGYGPGYGPGSYGGGGQSAPGGGQMMINGVPLSQMGSQYSPSNPPPGYTWEQTKYGGMYVPTGQQTGGGGLDVGVQNYLNQQNQPGRGAAAPPPTGITRAGPGTISAGTTQAATPGAAAAPMAAAARPAGPLTAAAVPARTAATTVAPVAQAPAPRPIAQAAPPLAPPQTVTQAPAMTARPVGVPPTGPLAMSDEFAKAAQQNEGFSQSVLQAGTAAQPINIPSDQQGGGFADLGKQLMQMAAQKKKSDASQTPAAQTDASAQAAGAAETAKLQSDMAQAAPYSTAMGEDIESDPKAKKSVHKKTIADEFLDHLHPYSFQYKNPMDEPRQPPTGGRYLGIMSPDLQKIPEIGTQLVVPTPRGRMVAQKPALSAVMAGLGRINERLKLLEQEGGRHHYKGKK